MFEEIPFERVRPGEAFVVGGAWLIRTFEAGGRRAFKADGSYWYPARPGVRVKVLACTT